MVDSSKENRQRKSIRLPGYDYNQTGGYFFTLVTKLRECLFGEITDNEMILSPLGVIARECWYEIPTHFPNISLDAFIIMPNHLHGIIIINEPPRRGTIYRAPTSYTMEKFGKPTIGSLPTIIRTYKAAVTRRAGIELNMSSIWQKNYYEHILRGDEDYRHISAYIESNPLNWGIDEERPI